LHCCLVNALQLLKTSDNLSQVQVSCVSISENKCYIKEIDEKIPEGICGTGIVSAVATFLNNGIIDKTGKYNDTYFLPGFTFYQNITLSQDDIREFQLAKGAVRAGLVSLMRKAGINDIDKLYIAGGFGTNLNVKDASTVGLIPPYMNEKCQTVGNSSLEGAIAYLTDKESFRKINKIIDLSEEINLANDDDFQSLYVKYMNF